MPTNRNNHVGAHARNAVAEMQMEAKVIKEKAQSRACELSGAARERAVGFQQQIEERITQNPLKSVLIAVGAGVVLGFLWRR